MLVDRDEPWHVGFAPHTWTGLADHLRRRGFTTAELRAAGLVHTSSQGRTIDMFHDRIVFPICDLPGNTIAFIGRLWPGGRPDAPKYLNSPDTAIYTKGQHLFGLHQQRDRVAAGWAPVLVEGPIDAVAVWLAYPRRGWEGFVAAAPCGTALTREQVGTLVAMPGARRGVTVAFDGDEAGRSGADRAFQLLAAHPSVPVRGAELPPGSDPGDLLRIPDGSARLRDVLRRRTRPMLHLLLRHRLDQMLGRFPRMLHEVEGRVALARALAPLIAEQQPDPAVAAIRQLSSYARTRIGGPDGRHYAAELLLSLTMAVAEHLETTPGAPPGEPEAVL